MYQIQNLTDDARQKQTLVLPDGSQIAISIYFIPMQIGWFITELTYKNFTLNGLRISNNPNLLYQYRNQLPFGLACFSPTTNREPTQQGDFLSGSSILYILSAEEVVQYSELLSGQI